MAQIDHQKVASQLIEDIRAQGAAGEVEADAESALKWLLELSELLYDAKQAKNQELVDWCEQEMKWPLSTLRQCQLFGQQRLEQAMKSRLETWAETGLDFAAEVLSLAVLTVAKGLQGAF